MVDTPIVVDLVARRDGGPAGTSVICVPEPEKKLDLAGDVVGLLVLSRISHENVHYLAALAALLAHLFRVNDLFGGQSRAGDASRAGYHPNENVWETVLRLIRFQSLDAGLFAVGRSF